MRVKVMGFALTLACFLAGSSGIHAQQNQRLTIERLYSLPRLIGTAPKGFAWSRDSQRLAFLWNDEGTNFYDVWTLDVTLAYQAGERRNLKGTGNMDGKHLDDIMIPSLSFTYGF